MSRISSAGLTHTNGFGFLFHSLIHLRMSASSSVTLRCAERRSLWLVSSANQRSTRLSHDELVGVKCRWKRGWRSSHLWISGVLWVGRVVVQHQVQVQVGGDGGVDELEEAQELLVAVPGAAGQLAGVSRSRRSMTCEVLMDQILATGKLLTTRQPSAA